MKKVLFLQYNFFVMPEIDNEKLLDQILKTEIPTLFKEDFADYVVKKAFKQMALRQLLTELMAYAGVVVTGLLSLLVIISGVILPANATSDCCARIILLSNSEATCLTSEN